MTITIASGNPSTCPGDRMVAQAHSALFQHLQGATERRARPQRTRPEPETRQGTSHGRGSNPALSPPNDGGTHHRMAGCQILGGHALRLLGRGNTNAGRYDEWRPPVNIGVAWQTRCDRRTLLRICRDLSFGNPHTEWKGETRHGVPSTRRPPVSVRPSPKPPRWCPPPNTSSTFVVEAQAGEFHGATSSPGAPPPSMLPSTPFCRI